MNQEQKEECYALVIDRAALHGFQVDKASELCP